MSAAGIPFTAPWSQPNAKQLSDALVLAAAVAPLKMVQCRGLQLQTNVLTLNDKTVYRLNKL